MLQTIAMLFLLSAALFSAQYTNALIGEESPYLQQHAHHPVDWMPWGDAAFAKARREHKPLFLSIGYSTCHWCHVMAHESFENPEIAALINRWFVPVKVDREQMPHIDSRYQQLFRQVKGRNAGWPLSVFLTEDRRPFFLAGYLPPADRYGIEGLATLIPKLGRLYRSDQRTIEAMVETIASAAVPSAQPDSNITINTDLLYASLEARYDPLFGGFSRAPKFPEAATLTLALDLCDLGYGDACGMAMETLRALALRGLYDHTGGGFFRYATDAAWEIPHFEKMLYTQAELIPLYVRAFRRTRDVLFRTVVTETIRMLQRRFEKGGLFYSASDADSTHIEGGYFVYTSEEIRHALDGLKHRQEIGRAFDLESGGNFGGKFHLNIYEDARPPGLSAFVSKLRAYRNTRPYPFIDKKIITAWNAMTVEALFDAGALDAAYTEQAKRSLTALLGRMRHKDGHLFHQALPDKPAKQPGLLEDYAFTVSALIAAYESTYDTVYLIRASALNATAVDLFYRRGTWVQNSDTPAVEADLNDRYYTSALGKTLQNLYRLAALEADLHDKAIADNTLKQCLPELKNRLSNAPSAATAWLMRHYGVVVLKQRKKRLQKYKKAVENIRYPFLLTKTDGSGLWLACTAGSCFAYDKHFGTIGEKIEKRAITPHPKARTKPF